jgi:hypothetical protein
MGTDKFCGEFAVVKVWRGLRLGGFFNLCFICENLWLKSFPLS